MSGRKKRENEPEPRRMPVPEDLRKVYGDTLISRGYAAWLLGISKTELIRREKDGIYEPVTDSSGGKWYDENVIRKYSDKRRRFVKTEAASKPSIIIQGYSSEHAAIVFGDLNSGKSLDVIVIERQIHPEAVLSIAGAYARVKSALFVTKEHLTKIEHLPLKGNWPPENADSLVTMIASTATVSVCARCQRRPSRLCGACASAAMEETVNGATKPEAATPKGSMR